MFRRGGSTGEGITSGLRQGYKEGDLATIRSQLELINKLAPEPERPKSRAGADFWLNFGSSILAQPGGRPILQTLGTAGQEPLKQYQQQKSQEDLLDYKSQQGQRALVAELVQGLSDDQLKGIEEKIQLHMRTHPGSTYEESSRAVWDTIEYSKSGHVREGENVENRLNFYETYLMNQVNKPPASAVRAVANHLYKMETGGYKDQLSEKDIADLGSKVWFSDLDLDQNVEGGAAHIENGEIVKYKLSPNGINKWTPYKGKIIFDYRTGKLFRVMGTFLEVVEDINEK
jgi:cytochrome c553